MLTLEEKKQINEAAAHYPLKRAAGIDALRIVQRLRGWISDEVLCAIAAALEMTPTDLDSVATFYNLIFRRPVGRHIILVCDSVSCWIMEYDNLLDHLKRRLGIDLGQTTADGRFTLLPHVCLGACDQAPVMMIDDQLYGFLDAGKIDAILESFE
ncbi:MAG: NADH-quinone oxidoreductase subunit NuoE [Desulfatitalea sp.]